MKTSLYAGALLAVLSLGLGSAAAQTTTTYLLDFGGGGASGYTSSNTGSGDINYLLGSSNGTGFDVNQVVSVINQTGASGDTFSFGSYTLTTTSAYSSYNVSGSATDNTGVYGTFFLTHGATPVTFSISGLNPTDTVSIAFLASQAWSITLSASTTSDFSSNTVQASNSGDVTNTTPFTSIGSLTGSSVLYTSFIATGSQEGDLSGMMITVTTSAIPEPSTYAALLGLAALGFVVVRRRLRS